MIPVSFPNRTLCWRMGVTVASMVITLLAAAQAHAQVAAPFLGTWKANWKTEKSSYEAVMTVTETGGTWQTANYDRNNACAGREVPLKVMASTPTELQLQLQFSEVMAGCQNPTVVLKAAPDGTVTGTRSKLDLVLVKK